MEKSLYFSILIRRFVAYSKKVEKRFLKTFLFCLKLTNELRNCNVKKLQILISIFNVQYFVEMNEDIDLTYLKFAMSIVYPKMHICMKIRKKLDSNSFCSNGLTNETLF